MDDVSTDKPKEPGDDPQREQQEQQPRCQSQSQSQDQYALPPFPAMTAIRAMSGLPGTGVLPSVSPQSARPCHKLPFVQPSSYLRPKTRSRTVPVTPTPMSPVDEEQMQGLKGLRDFLRVRTSYDVLPLSFRLIVLDNDLLIKKSLNILDQNGIVSAPLWDSHNSRFAGLLTSTDYINLIQYYCQFPEQVDRVEEFRLSSLRGTDSAPKNPSANLDARGKIAGRSQQLMIEVLTADIEKAIGVLPLETVSVHPSRPLYEACSRMLKSRARRIPLVDTDDETGRETIVSVITQYRILKFIAVNTEQHTMLLKKTVREINLGTYKNLITAMMSDTVLDVINQMVVHNISAIPIVDKNNVVLNVFEAVDVIHCIKGGAYEDLTYTVGEALCKRADDFPGIYTCQEDDRLESIFTTVRQSRVHRLVVIDDNWHLKGIISLSDILKPQPALNDRRSKASSGLVDSLDPSGDNSSVTWTSSSGDFGLLSEADDVEGRDEFVDEYNRTAKKYGIRLIVPGDFSPPASKGPRHPPPEQSVDETQQDHRRVSRPRSISGIALNLVHSGRKDTLKDASLSGMVRLCGKSLFYLPIDDERVVDALYDHYCTATESEDVARTICSPALPAYARFNVHGVAAAFKRFPAGLPGGILGSLAVLDALVPIHSQLDRGPEHSRTKETRLQARLIALTIGSVGSQYQRELICAVFGLLNLLGRAAETTPREDEVGHPLPTSELMGYNALSTVFGPLLDGDMLGSYNMRVADPVARLVLLPGVAPKSKSKQKPKLGHGKSKTAEGEGKASSITIDKIGVVNGITEMIITNWREVVRHLRSLDALKASRHGQQYGQARKGRTLRSSASESFVIERHLAWNGGGPSTVETGRRVSAGASAEPLSPDLRTTPTLVLLDVTAAGVVPPPHKHDIRSLLRMPNVRRSKSDDNLRTGAKVDAATVQNKKNTEAGKSERWSPPLKSLLERWNISYAHVSEANADHASEHFDERDIPAEPTAEVTELEPGNIYLDTVEHLPEEERGNAFEQSPQVALYTIEVAPAHDQGLLTAKPSDMAETQDSAQRSTSVPAPGSEKSIKPVESSTANRKLLSTDSDSDLPHTALRRTGRGKVTRVQNASLQLSVLSSSMMRSESRISGGRKLQVPQGQEGPGTHHVESARDLDRGDDYYSQQSDGGTPPSLSYQQSCSLLQARVHSLLQRLEACNEEVAGLQRRLETLETFGKNSLYEQLQQARLEARAWRKRAEVAEHRVLVPGTLYGPVSLAKRGCF
ncbi:hypothetical protein DL770_005581 [Monosporascus sp. CRB-9-2]|nr:hypothetical protein DL770_005581 [Monosporascus sp. CRB-9-2]